jgi:hypothetical protein
MVNWSKSCIFDPSTQNKVSIMKKFLAAFLLVSCTFFACNNQAKEEQNEVIDTRDSIIEAIVKPKVENKENTIEARFIEFSLGDREHYIFEDLAGNQLDFASCDSKDFEFSKELEEKMANESNQGWGSNSALIGKWFLLEFQNKNAPAYEDGPMEESKRIVAVKQLD